MGSGTARPVTFSYRRMEVSVVNDGRTQRSESGLANGGEWRNIGTVASFNRWAD